MQLVKRLLAAARAIEKLIKAVLLLVYEHPHGRTVGNHDGPIAAPGVNVTNGVIHKLVYSELNVLALVVHLSPGELVSN